LTSVDAPDWWRVWTLSTGGAPSGSASIPLPKTPGIYVFRYFMNGSYAMAGQSNSLAIANSGYTISSATSGKAGSNLTFSFTAGANRTSNDYIGLYQTGSTNDAPAVSVIATKGAASGTHTLTVPAGGTYELRYIMGSSSYTYIAAAISSTITAH
jgi:hypothetical protein